MRLTQDLQPEPSLIIRLPPRVINNVKGATLKIVFNNNMSQKVDCDDAHGSVLIGRNILFMPAFLERWKLELLSRGITDPTATALIIRAWQTPLRPSIALALEPGTKVSLELSRDGLILSRVEYEISGDRIQDIGMFMEELKP